MFEQTFVQSPAKTRRPWTVAVSLLSQCLIVAMLLLFPLLHPEAMRMPEPPSPRIFRTWLNRPPLPPPTANPRTVAAPLVVTPRPIFVLPGARVSTNVAPRVSAPLGETELTNWPGLSAEAFGSPLTGALVLLPPGTPPPVSTRPLSVATGPIRVTGGVEEARLLYGPRPVYPAIAKAAHSQGVVRMEAIIAADGVIRNLHVLSGPPLLVDAARDAVRQWRYQPTLLNGVAVEVLTEIDVNFRLTE
jgi:protein TonB